MVRKTLNDIMTNDIMTSKKRLRFSAEPKKKRLIYEENYYCKKQNIEEESWGFTCCFRHCDYFRNGVCTVYVCGVVQQLVAELGLDLVSEDCVYLEVGLQQGVVPVGRCLVVLLAVLGEVDAVVSLVGQKERVVYGVGGNHCTGASTAGCIQQQRQSKDRL